MLCVRSFPPFAKSWSKRSTRRQLVQKLACSPLHLELLEDRTVPANLLGPTANTFAILAGSTVTNTGPSIVNGNLGVSPGTAVTGYPPGTVVPPGTIHAADAVALEAQTEVTTAYNTLAGLPSNTSLTGQDLGGLTLTPGVYTFTSSAQLTGTLTLDDQGNPNALFVFQIGSTLTTASNSAVVFLNNAMDGEVYWQVGSSATLGTDTSFVGNIVALTSITLDTDASIQCGRALAQNGAVTMDSNNITTVCAIPPGSISGMKFNDLNGDGIQERGEPALAGVTVFLDLHDDGTLDPGDPSTTTDANGDYTFANLAPGTYRVREAAQAELMQTTPNPADITLGSGQDVTGVNFGDFRLISISGSKFNDLNGNGVRDPGEPGLAGITVFLDTNNNGILDPGERFTTTDANGNFTFANVGPGTYRVREAQQPGLLQITPVPAPITTSSGQNVTTITFGDFRLISISGEKFNDLNGNHTKDAGEPGLANWFIYLDSNDDGIYEPGEPFVLTNAEGDYQFNNLGPGTYYVREVQQSGWLQTTITPGAITAVSGQNQTGVNFGNFSVSPEILSLTSGNNSLVPTFPPTSPALTQFLLSSKNLLLGSTLLANASGMMLTQVNFVSGLYQSVLGRPPDDAGLIADVQFLQDGFTRAVLADIVWQSAEHRMLEVNQFYAEFLHRTASSAESAVWANALMTGTSELDVMRDILSSPEYMASHSSDSAFINGLYGDVLSRASDPAGQAAWLQALANGMSREALAQAFLTSAEASKRVVDDFYANYLGRAGDPAGEQFAVTELQNGQASYESLAEAFLASDEYLVHVNVV
jgi:hypothetical protein